MSAIPNVLWGADRGRDHPGNYIVTPQLSHGNPGYLERATLPRGSAF